MQTALVPKVMLADVELINMAFLIWCHLGNLAILAASPQHPPLRNLWKRIWKFRGLPIPLLHYGWRCITFYLQFITCCIDISLLLQLVYCVAIQSKTLFMPQRLYPTLESSPPLDELSYFLEYWLNFNLQQPHECFINVLRWFYIFREDSRIAWTILDLLFWLD